MFLIISLIMLWLWIGASSFIHWWRKDFDLTVMEIPFIILGALCGPLTYLMGWITHGDINIDTTKVLMKKKKINKPFDK